MDRQGVLVIGSMNYDSFYTLPHQMRLGENLHAVDYQTACGGKGANQAVQCAKLSLSTHMLGCLGNDDYGNQIYAGMQSYGVDMSLVRRADTPTGNAAVWVYPNSEVQAALFGGANMCVRQQDIDGVLPLLEKSAIVILQNEIPMDMVEYAASAAKKAGCYILYNAAPALPVSEKTLVAADLLVVNEAEASYYSGVHIMDEPSAVSGARKLLPRLGGTLIITLGSLGSLVAQESGMHLVPAQKVRAVETTGAGDSYVGALAYGLMKGWPILETAGFATMAAAITVSSVGAQPSMPTLAMIRAYNTEFMTFKDNL